MACHLTNKTRRILFVDTGRTSLPDRVRYLRLRHPRCLADFFGKCPGRNISSALCVVANFYKRLPKRPEILEAGHQTRDRASPPPVG